MPELTATTEAGTSQVAKQKPQLERRFVRRRNLNTRYHVDCPVGGKRFIDFSWGVVYESEVDNIYAVGMANIDGFEGLNYYYHLRPRYFKAAFRRRICLDYGCTACTYNFRGHFEGEVYREGLYLRFFNINDDPTHARSPWVTESCEHHGLQIGYNTCPAISWNFCQIAGIEVTPANVEPNDKLDVSDFSRE